MKLEILTDSGWKECDDAQTVIVHSDEVRITLKELLTQNRALQVEVDSHEGRRLLWTTGKDLTVGPL